MLGTLGPWAFVMLSAGAPFGGGLVWQAWERVWIWRRLDLPAYRHGLSAGQYAGPIRPCRSSW
jgi:hypothetical protein